MARKHQVDCSFKCPAKGYIDFPVWPRKGESSTDACRRKLATRVDAPQVPLCETIRIRSIDGLGKGGTRLLPIRIKDLGSAHITAAAARALRACRLAVNEDCLDSCRVGIHALERELKGQANLGRPPRVRIIRED
jgi:hypothetical protein